MTVIVQLGVAALRRRLIEVEDDAPIFWYVGNDGLLVQAEPVGKDAVVLLKSAPALNAIHGGGAAT